MTSVSTARRAKSDASVAPVARLRSPAWLSACALVVVMVVVGLIVAHYLARVTEWRVMGDELLYVDMARSIAHSGSPWPVVRGEHVAIYSVLYPLIIAPFVGAFDAPTAFKAIRVVNVVVMVSTAIPAYLLARQAVTRRGALVVATLSVLVPWITASASVMTEVAAYPTFTWAVFAMTYAIGAPSVRADLVALVAIGIACLARSQFALLVVAFPVAILLHEMARRAMADGIRDVRSIALRAPVQAVRSHVLAAVAVAIGVVLLVFDANTVLGSYSVTTTRDTLLPAGIAGSALDHLAYIVVGIGAIPAVFAIAFVLQTLGRAVDARTHALASVILVVVVVATLVATSFDLRFITQGRQVQERYVFYIAPLLFAGAVAWFAQARGRIIPLAVGAAATAGIVLAQSYKPIAQPQVEGFASPNRYFFAVLDGRLRVAESWVGLHDPSTAVAIAVVCVLSAVLAVVLVRKAGAAVALAAFALVVGVYLAAQLVYVLPRVADDHNGFARTLLGVRPLATRDWVDEVGSDRSTGAVVGTIKQRPGAPDLGPYHTPAEWWDVAFWNKSIDRLYTYGSFNIAPLVIGPVGQLTLDFASGNISATGPSPPQQLLLATDNTGFVPEHRGPAVQKGDLTLYRTPPPYRAQWATQWVDEDGWTLAGHTIRLRVYGGRGLPAGAAQVGIALRAAADGPHRYTLTYDGVTKKRVVRDRRLERLEICTPSSGHTDVQLRVPGGVHMGYRSVGVQLLRIQTQATGKPCRTS